MTNPLYTHFWPALLATTALVGGGAVVMVGMLNWRWPLNNAPRPQSIFLPLWRQWFPAGPDVLDYSHSMDDEFMADVIAPMRPLYAVIEPETGIVMEAGRINEEGQLAPFDDSISSYDHEPLPFSKDDEREYERRAADYKAGRPQDARGIGGYWPGRVLTLTEQQRN